MRLFYNNLIDYAATVITESSEVATLPSSNVANEFRKRVWRTGTSTAAEWIVFDLGSAKAVTAVILLDHTLTNSDTLIKLEAHTSDSWGAPSFSQALTWAEDIISAVFASQSYRFWRVSFTKSAAAESRDIGRIFLGPHESTEEDPDSDGVVESIEDDSRITKSLGGQTYTDAIEKYGRIAVQFSSIPNTMAASLKTFYEYVGKTKSFFVQVQTSGPLTKIWYVKNTEELSREVAGMDAELIWDVALEMEEQL